MTAFRRTKRRAAVGVATLALAGTGLFVALSAPAGATTVTDEATFRAAWTNAAETSIDLAADITLTCGGGGVAVRNSATALSLDGHGHTITQSCANNGVLEQNGFGALSLQNVTITGGAAPGDGGGVHTAGDATLTNATITNSTAAGQGGGLRAQGAVTVTNSTISNNTSSTGGGGFWAEGAVTVTTSTISGNHDNGTFGGGGFRANSDTAMLTVTKSTITGNDAGLSGGIGGGGIAATGPTTISNSTISGNTAGSFGGGGIAVGVPGTVTLVYATVAGNTAPATCVLGTCGTNVSGSGGHGSLVSFGSVVALPEGGGSNCAQLAGTTSNGFNFSDDSSCSFTAATDKQSAGDPGLGPLASNGGPTQTRLPQPGSPLIDAIPTASCQADGATGITTDQRGVSRPQGAGCDIGAVEVEQAAPPAPAAPVQAVVRFTG